MTLDNNAKIGDIITALEGMQAINQKAELASVIGSPATATDNIATQITKIQDAKNVIAEKTGQENTLPLLEMANGIVTGKKWASGTSALTTGATLLITGLDFTPSKGFIFMKQGVSSTSNLRSIIGIFDAEKKMYVNGSVGNSNMTIIDKDGYSYNSGLDYTPTVNAFDFRSGQYQNITGLVGVVVQWYAFE